MIEETMSCGSGGTRSNVISRSSILHGFDDQDYPRWFDLDQCFEENLQDTFKKLDGLDDDIWGKVIVMERNVRIAKAYLRQTVVTVNGGERDFDGITIGFKSFRNPLRDRVTDEFRNRIGSGLRIRVEFHGDMLAKRFCKAPVTVYSPCVAQAEKYNEEGLEFVRVRLPEGKRGIKVFDMRKFKRAMETELFCSSTAASRGLQRLLLRTVVAFSLVRESSQLLNSPCWFFVINLIALDMIHAKVGSLHIPFPLKENPDNKSTSGIHSKTGTGSHSTTSRQLSHIDPRLSQLSIEDIRQISASLTDLNGINFHPQQFNSHNTNTLPQSSSNRFMTIGSPTPSSAISPFGSSSASSDNNNFVMHSRGGEGGHFNMHDVGNESMVGGHSRQSSTSATPLRPASMYIQDMYTPAPWLYGPGAMGVGAPKGLSNPHLTGYFSDCERGFSMPGHRQSTINPLLFSPGCFQNDNSPLVLSQQNCGQTAPLVNEQRYSPPSHSNESIYGIAAKPPEPIIATNSPQQPKNGWANNQSFSNSSSSSSSLKRNSATSGSISDNFEVTGVSGKDRRNSLTPVENFKISYRNSGNDSGFGTESDVTRRSSRCDSSNGARGYIEKQVRNSGPTAIPSKNLIKSAKKHSGPKTLNEPLLSTFSNPPIGSLRGGGALLVANQQSAFKPLKTRNKSIDCGITANIQDSQFSDVNQSRQYNSKKNVRDLENFKNLGVNAVRMEKFQKFEFSQSYDAQNNNNKGNRDFNFSHSSEAKNRSMQHDQAKSNVKKDKFEFHDTFMIEKNRHRAAKSPSPIYASTDNLMISQIKSRYLPEMKYYPNHKSSWVDPHSHDPQSYVNSGMRGTTNSHTMPRMFSSTGNLSPPMSNPSFGHSSAFGHSDSHSSHDDDDSTDSDDHNATVICLDSD